MEESSPTTTPVEMAAARHRPPLARLLGVSLVVCLAVVPRVGLGGGFAAPPPGLARRGQELCGHSFPHGRGTLSNSACSSVGAGRPAAAAGSRRGVLGEEVPRGSRLRLWAPLVAATAAFKKLAGHRLRVPAKLAASPVAEIVFCFSLLAVAREAVRSYHSATFGFSLRDDLFQDMAVAHTYKNSVGPWVQTGIITVIASIFIIFGVRKFIKSMKEWEQRQEMKEMSQMGEDALFLMSTPIDATPLEKKQQRMKRRLMPWPVRFMGSIMDTLWMFRVGACVGYLLPLLNVLDFGEISVSLYPYPLGVPPSEPIVNFMQNTLGMRYLYNAYLKSGYYFLIVWFLFIQFAVRNKAMPFFLRFHSSQAILISMLLGVPQQVFFAVLNPWESGLVIQTFMYHSMVAIFLFVLGLVMWCCVNALRKKQMSMPLVSEAAVMWAGRE